MCLHHSFRQRAHVYRSPNPKWTSVACSTIIQSHQRLASARSMAKASGSKTTDQAFCSASLIAPRVLLVIACSALPHSVRLVVLAPSAAWTSLASAAWFVAPLFRRIFKSNRRGATLTSCALSQRRPASPKSESLWSSAGVCAPKKARSRLSSQQLMQAANASPKSMPSQKNSKIRLNQMSSAIATVVEVVAPVAVNSTFSMASQKRMVAGRRSSLWLAHRRRQNIWIMCNKQRRTRNVTSRLMRSWMILVLLFNTQVCRIKPLPLLANLISEEAWLGPSALSPHLSNDWERGAEQHLGLRRTNRWKWMRGNQASSSNI